MRNLYGVISCCVLLSLAVVLDNAYAKKPPKTAEVSAIYLDVLKIKACAAGQGCSTVGGPKQINLLEMAEGKTDFAKQVLLPARTHELRLLLGKNSTIAVDGQTYPLAVPSGQSSGLKLKGQKVFGKTGGFLADIMLHFNLAKGLIVKAKKGKGKNSPDTMVYSLKPVIQVSSAEVTPLPENMAAVVAVPDKDITLAMGEEFLLQIPAGAVTEPTVILAEKIEYAAYELYPNGQKFLKPVTITISYSALYHKEAGYSDEELKIWRNGAILSGINDVALESITASTKEFSLYVILPEEYDECSKKVSVESLKNIPYIMRNKGWSFAADLMDFWFFDSENRSNFIVYNIDILSDTFKEDIAPAIDSFKGKANENKLFDGVLNFIVDNLQRTPTKNISGQYVIPNGGSFDHIEIELNAAKKESWHDAEWEQKNMFYSVDKALNKFDNNLLSTYSDYNQFLAAFGVAQLRAVAKGEVIIDNNIANIKIKEAGIYFRDSYDFVGEQRLGCWTDKDVHYFPFRRDNEICVCNSTFRGYNKVIGREENEGNFRIFTDPKDMVVQTNQSFEYQIPETKPSVDSVLPKNAVLDETTTFIVKGKDFPPNLVFDLQNCVGVEAINSSLTERQFRCTPSGSVGEKEGKVRTSPDGEVLYRFTVNVAGTECGKESRGQDPHILYSYANGKYEIYRRCAAGCDQNIQACKQTLPSCPSKNGSYCGNVDSSLDDDTLYKCENGAFWVEKECTNGCEKMGVGVNDECRICKFGTGYYCGSIYPSLYDNILYYCQKDGVFSEDEQCANGCQENEDYVDDKCKSSSDPEESFTCTSGLQTVTRDDGRTWQRCDDGKTYLWQDAKDYCDNLVLGDHSDWRLPTNDELRDLVVCTNGTSTPLDVYPDDSSVPYSCDSHNSAPYDRPTISSDFECKSEPYWSSSPYSKDTSYTLTVDFNYGWSSRENPATNNFYVRCVR